MQVDEAQLTLDMHDFNNLNGEHHELENVWDQECENVEAENEVACFLIIEVPFDDAIDSLYCDYQKDRADVVDNKHSQHRKD